MTKFRKWMKGITAQDALCDVARRSVGARLDAVEYYLPLAAERAADDVEHVHQLRVWTRRSMAAIQLYAEVLPLKEARWMRKQLRKIRRAAGEARDMDVLIQNRASDAGAEAHVFLTDVRQRRKTAQEPLRAIYRQLTKNDRLHRRKEKLLSQLDPPSASSAFGPWATARVQSILDRFFAASPADMRDLDGLHRFRIRCKQLRYAMELLASAFPVEFRQQLYPAIELLQDRLGEIQDYAVARDRLGKWISNAVSKRQALHMHALRQQEQERLEELLQSLVAWWTPECERQLRESFDKMIERQT